MTEPKYVLIRRLFVRDKTELGNAQSVTSDGAGNLFVLTTVLENNATTIYLNKLDRARDYKSVGEWIVDPLEGQKVDDMGVTVPPLSRDVIIQCQAHSAISYDPNPNAGDPNRNDTQHLIIFEGIADPAPVSGYVPGPEPCVLPDKLPYFRRSAPVTRSQVMIILYRLTKLLVALVRNATGNQSVQMPTLSGGQKFQDVSLSQVSTETYDAINWGYDQKLIGGYPCKEEG